jgi:hypothetical protein|tara:strand:+ start:460 stop:672 length:213 start_codon:yes stop_codon:yes gene_type:complete
MSERLGEAESILDKKEISIKDYKRFREIGRLIKIEEQLYFASFDEALHLRLPEIAQKEGNWDWLEAEDEE